jgi:hypothetical protein
MERKGIEGKATMGCEYNTIQYDTVSAVQRVIVDFRSHNSQRRGSTLLYTLINTYLWRLLLVHYY